MKRFYLSKPDGSAAIIPAETIEVEGNFVIFITDGEIVGVATNFEGVIEESLLGSVEQIPAQE